MVPAAYRSGGHLYLGEGTVRNNIVVIMEKLCVANRTQLGMLYYEKMHT